MSEVHNYKVTDFIKALETNAGEGSAHRIAENMDLVKSIFERAAVKDNPHVAPDDIFEADEAGFNELVQKALGALRLTHVLGQEDPNDVRNGDFAVRDNTTFQREDGKWVRLGGPRTHVIGQEDFSIIEEGDTGVKNGETFKWHDGKWVKLNMEG